MTRLRLAALLSGGLGGFEASASFLMFPEIQRDLAGGDAAAASWVLSIGGIVGAAILLQAGRLADRFGHFRLFLSGAVLFTSASLLATAAPRLWMLVVARALQAAGTSMLGPSAIALIIADAPAERRNAVIGQWGFFVGAFGVLGPPISAGIIELTNWRVPFLVFALAGAGIALLARSEPVPHHVANPRPIDAPGSVLAALGLASLVLGLAEGNTWGWSSGRVIGCFMASAVILAAVVVRSRGQEDPTLPIDLFRSRRISLSLLTGLTANLCFFAQWVVLLRIMTVSWGYSLTHAGLLLAVMPLTFSLLSVPAGRVADRIGHRIVMVTGAVAYAAMFAVFAAIVTEEAQLPLMLFALIGAGIGMGLVWPFITSVGTQPLPLERMGTGAALIQTTQRVGGAFGSALAVGLMTTAGGTIDLGGAWILPIGGVLTAVLCMLLRSSTRVGSSQGRAAHAA